MLQPTSSQTSQTGTVQQPRLGSRLSRLVRVALPIAIIGGAIAGYLRLAVPTDETKEPPAEKQKLRTAVAELEVVDYPIVVTTQGIVQAHNEVTLSAEVSGQIQSISPSFRVGAYFSKGEVLVELDARDYETATQIANAQQQSARAALDLAEQSYTRSLKLSNQNIVSEAELSQALATKSQAAAELASATARLDQATRDLTRTKIVAAFDGRVRERAVGVGQSLAIGSPLGVVFSVDYAEVRLPIAARERAFLTLPELADAPSVKVILSDAIDRLNKTTWEAEIVRTEGALDADSLELFAIARIDDPFGLSSGLPPIRIGQPVKAMIAGKTLSDVVAVPRMAVRRRNQIVLVDEKQLTLSTKKIEAIWSDEQHVIIPNDPVYADSLLATTHLVYTPDGSEVEILASPAVATSSADSDATTTNGAAISTSNN